MTHGPPTTRLTFADVERCLRLLVQLVPMLWLKGWHLQDILFEDEQESFLARFRWQDEMAGASAYVRLRDGQFECAAAARHGINATDRAVDQFLKTVEPRLEAA